MSNLLNFEITQMVGIATLKLAKDLLTSVSISALG